MGLRIDRQRFHQRARCRLQHVAVNLVLHASRVDHQARVLADDDAAHVHLAGRAIHFHIGDPRRPGRTEAGEPAVHVARVGEALALEQIAFGRLLLRRGVRQPTRTRSGRCDKIARTLVFQVLQAERDRVGARRGRELVDVGLVRERVRQRRDTAQPRGAQDRRHVVRDDAQVGVVVGRHRRAVAHFVGVRCGLGSAREQQRERRRAVARVGGLEVAGRRTAFGIEPAAHLHELRRALRLPQVLLRARELHAHRRADRAREQRRIGGHVVGAVAAVAAGGLHADHVDCGVGQARQRREIGAQHVRVLRAGPDGQCLLQRLRFTPVGQRARGADRRVQLVRPDVVALHRLGRTGDRRIDIAFFHQHAAARRVVAQRVLQIAERRAAGPLAPCHFERQHRRLGLFFALGDDADEIADHDHRANPCDVSDRVLVDRLQRVADEITGVDARIRRPHDAAVQHAGHALVVHEHLVAAGLGRDVDARRRGADDAVVGRRLERRVVREHQPHVAAGELLAHACTRLRRQPRARLRCGAAQRFGMHLDRGACDRRALVRRDRRAAEDHVDGVERGVELLGDDLRERGADAGAEVDMAVQRGDAAVVPHGDQRLVAFGGIGRHRRRLPRGRQPGRWRRARDEQHAAGGAEVSARVRQVGTPVRHLRAVSSAARCTACRISRCVPQRQRLCASASRACCSVGCGKRCSSATVPTIIPLRQ